MTIALILTSALLTAPIAFLKRTEIDLTIRSIDTILNYLVRTVALRGVMVVCAALAALFSIVTVTEGNPTVYIGPLAVFSFNTVLAITGGVLVPWLTIIGVQAVRLRRRRAV